MAWEFSPIIKYTITVVAFGLIMIPSALYFRMNPSKLTNLMGIRAPMHPVDEGQCRVQKEVGEPYAIRSRRVVTPAGLRHALIVIDNGKIGDILRADTEIQLPVQDVGNLVVMAGLIDPHVHVNEPGRTEWEGFESATAAAAAGGTTTLLDMPLNCVPPTVSLSAMEQKISAIRDAKLSCDVGLIGGAVPGFLDQITPLAKAGVFAFKSFMIDSQSVDFPHVNSAYLVQAMSLISKLEGAPYVYILHAEKNSEEDEALPEAGEHSDQDHAKHLQSRPEVWETRAIDEAIRASDQTGCHIHIAHVGSSKAAEIIHNAKIDGAYVTAEVCTHHLLFQSKKIPRGNTLFKCAPPIRSEDNRLGLWKALLKDGSLDIISSDHSPSPPELKHTKEGDFTKAWGGIAGLQYRLQGTWTASQPFELDFMRLSELLSGRVADIFGLSESKGRIVKGLDADLVIWDPEEEQVIQESQCLHRHKASAYTGQKLMGRVKKTIVHGEIVYDDDEGIVGASPGKLLLSPLGRETGFLKRQSEMRSVHEAGHTNCSENSGGSDPLFHG
eukprot:CAMPEP_0184744404 /NCGR_PEP_ID=MMETSP0315-20130426/7177_1 /TAXON_ID=101924 /ORGANISM="Rhodosorus marinus, Strain UTEX LB 2760" /LENGTH=553 /DNA_ID=CAMNT_0027216105 /DNA_START=95 /DNA_END=1757 /DNA_ORIENTATION=+